MPAAYTEWLGLSPASCLHFQLPPNAYCAADDGSCDCHLAGRPGLSSQLLFLCLAQPWLLWAFEMWINGWTILCLFLCLTFQKNFKLHFWRWYTSVVWEQVLWEPERDWQRSLRTHAGEVLPRNIDCIRQQQIRKHWPITSWRWDFLQETKSRWKGGHPPPLLCEDTRRNRDPWHTSHRLVLASCWCRPQEAVNQGSNH